MSKKRNSLALERGHIKHTEHYQVPWGTGKFDERDEELEWLHRLVRDLELKARGRHQRRDRDDQERGVGSEGNRCGVGSNHSGSRPRRDRSHS